MLCGIKQAWNTFSVVSSSSTLGGTYLQDTRLLTTGKTRPMGSRPQMQRQLHTVFANNNDDDDDELRDKGTQALKGNKAEVTRVREMYWLLHKNRRHHLQQPILISAKVLRYCIKRVVLQGRSLYPGSPPRGSRNARNMPTFAKHLSFIQPLRKERSL